MSHRTNTQSNRRWLTLLILSVAALGLSAVSLTGCDGKKDDAAEKPAKVDSAEVVQGDKPAWPEELAGAEIGKPVAAAKELDLGSGMDEEHWISKKFDDLAYFLRTDDAGNIESVRMAVRTDTDLAKKLEDTWGAGDPGPGGETLWFNPEAGLMAAYEPPGDAKDAHWLELKPYTPAATYIGTDKGVIGFTKDKPILGKTLEELKTDWADQWATNYDWIELQGTEFDPHGINVMPREGKDGKVESYRFEISMPDDKRQALIDQLVANLGEPVEGAVSGGTAHVFLLPETQTRVIVPTDTEGQLAVEVERYMPLAAMIGLDDKSKLAIEGETGWIGKLSEDDWKAKVANDGDTLWATATEYDGSHFIVSPRFTDGTLSSYRFSIDCDLQPKACPGVLETFKKAFGEPTEQEGFGGTKQLVFANEPPITLEADKDNAGWTVRVGQL